MSVVSAPATPLAPPVPEATRPEMPVPDLSVPDMCLKELDGLRLAEELRRAREELAVAEAAEHQRAGAPELLEARALHAANGMIAARLALLRLQVRMGRPLARRDRERMTADGAILALPPRGTVPLRPQAA